MKQKVALLTRIWGKKQFHILAGARFKIMNTEMDPDVSPVLEPNSINPLPF